MSDLIPADDLVITVPVSPGGQHAGTRSGLMVEHIPSGIKVFVDIDRSQHRNKAVAIAALEGALTCPQYR